MNELNSVVLTEDIVEYGLREGDIGAVVLVHGGAAGYEVEFATLSGDTIAVVTVQSSQVRPIRPQEIAHARLLVV